MALKTNYKDYIPPTGGRRYKVTPNADGSSSIEDITQYQQVGDAWGAEDINRAYKLVNGAVYPNLLDNSGFTNPVNQRGSSNYTSTTGYVYCIDRWRLYYGTYNVDSASIPAANTTRLFAQKLDIASTTQYSASFLVNGEKYSVSVESIEEKEFSTQATSLVETEDFIFHLYKPAADYVNYLFEIKANKTFAITWAKLEKGGVATPYVPKGYGVELAECRRYYQEHSGRILCPLVSHNQSFYGGYRYSNIISFAPPMRATPTINLASVGAGFVLPIVSAGNGQVQLYKTDASDALLVGTNGFIASAEL